MCIKVTVRSRVFGRHPTLFREQIKEGGISPTSQLSKETATTASRAIEINSNGKLKQFLLPFLYLCAEFRICLFRDRNPKNTEPKSCPRLFRCSFVLEVWRFRFHVSSVTILTLRKRFLESNSSRTTQP